MNLVERWIPEKDHPAVRRCLMDVSRGEGSDVAFLHEMKWVSPGERQISGSLLWQGRAHAFRASITDGDVLRILSWNEHVMSSLAPFATIVEDAVAKGKGRLLLDKWDELLARSDVSALLRRFDHVSFMSPGTETERTLRDSVASLGFAIVTIESAQRVRSEIEGRLAIFRTTRGKVPHG